MTLCLRLLLNLHIIYQVSFDSKVFDSPYTFWDAATSTIIRTSYVQRVFVSVALTRNTKNINTSRVFDLKKTFVWVNVLELLRNQTHYTLDLISFTLQFNQTIQYEIIRVPIFKFLPNWHSTCSHFKFTTAINASQYIIIVLMNHTFRRVNLSSAQLTMTLGETADTHHAVDTIFIYRWPE